MHRGDARADYGLECYLDRMGWNRLIFSNHYESHLCVCEIYQLLLCHTVQSHHEADDDATIDRTMYEMYYPELVATFTGNLLADIMLYPLETILYRLYLQVITTC